MSIRGHRGRYYQKALPIEEQISISWRRQVTMTCKMTRGLMTYDDDDEMERKEIIYNIFSQLVNSRLNDF